MKYALISVALVSMAFATSADAQQVISNPALCTQFYPNANCQNLGPGNPYTGTYRRPSQRHAFAWSEHHHRSVAQHRKSHRKKSH